MGCSVPVLDEAVPAGGRHFGGFVRVPQRSDADVVVRLELLEQLRRLPVPHEAATVGVAWRSFAAGRGSSAGALHASEVAITRSWPAN